MPPTVLWLLDVDGVLNAVARRPDRSVWQDWEHGTAPADGVRWPITFSPSVVRAVRAVHERQLAEVRWLTTWRAHANGELRQLFELPALPVVADELDPEPSPAAERAADDPGAVSHGAVTATPRRDANEWWKLTAVRGVVARVGPEVPLIWTDDDLRYEREAVAWVRTHVRDALLIAPPTTTGLTPRHLREIEEFCSRWAG